MSGTWIRVLIILGLTCFWWWQDDNPQQKGITTIVDRLDTQIKHTEGKRVLFSVLRADHTIMPKFKLALHHRK